MRTFLFLCSFLLATLPAQLAAQSKVLVELFTSQGCSSCPPADKLLKKLGGMEDTIVLAYHVDYWDYLGWKDTFAQNAFTKRQQAYARTVDRSWLGRPVRGSFTPEAVVQGSDSLIGADAGGILQRIVAHAEAAPAATLDAVRRAEGARIKLQPGADRRGGAVLMARYIPEAPVEVTRGENAGRTITYSHVVTDLTKLADWSGEEPLTLDIPTLDGPAVVFVQAGPAGPVLAVDELE